MSILVRCIAFGLVLTTLATAIWLDPGIRASAATLGTPTPVTCGDMAADSTPIASPIPDAATPGPEAAEIITNLASFRAALEARDLEVETEEPLEQPFLNATSVTRLLVTGDAFSGLAELQIYEYAGADRLAEDVSQITPDGNLETVMITWIATPHFFCGERLIVLYLGDDKEVIALLTELFGPQFAGR